MSHNSNGSLDYLGFSVIAGGLVASGWIDFGWDEDAPSPSAILEYAEDSLRADVTLCSFDRPDVRKLGRGFVALISCGRRPRGLPIELILKSGERESHLFPSDGLELLAEPELLARSKRLLLGSAPRSERRAHLLKQLNRTAFTGTDTLEQLSWPVFLEIDAVYLCPPSDLLLRGWCADPFRHIARMRARSGEVSKEIDLHNGVPILRPDVVEALEPKHGFTEERCGFLTLLPGIFRPGDPVYLELESETGELAHKPVPAPARTGLSAIREVLETFELRYDELRRAYDSVIGPAVTAMNQFRLSAGISARTISFGSRPPAPRCSIIVPLYGRIDFLEYQIAFFSRTLSENHELIYVLDDPKRQREAELLAASCFARFDRPFELVCLNANTGYAPANNIGLRHARGEYICFLNSDVFPRNPHWLEVMIGVLETRTDAGIVGAQLLFEDGTIQHEGCILKPLPEMGGWEFSLHTSKGRSPAPATDPARVDAVTGACMVMRRALALDVGGFDEGYAIGDFEDVDLCRKVNEKGLSCFVSRAAELYHLERQSQGDQAQRWRMNLTLYNAWRFHQKWEAKAAPGLASKAA
jgi:GT2 family glycosyltransferase